jgi:GntR family transcriptional regulator
VAYVPGLSESDLDGSLYEVLATRYRVVTGAAKVTIDPVLPDPRVGELLSIPSDQACLRLRMVDSDTRGRVIMVANCIYRGDKYQLTADVSGAAFSNTMSRRVG